MQAGNPHLRQQAGHRLVLVLLHLLHLRLQRSRMREVRGERGRHALRQLRRRVRQLHGSRVLLVRLPRRRPRRRRSLPRRAVPPLLARDTHFMAHCHLAPGRPRLRKAPIHKATERREEAVIYMHLIDERITEKISRLRAADLRCKKHICS